MIDMLIKTCVIKLCKTEKVYKISTVNVQYALVHVQVTFCVYQINTPKFVVHIGDNKILQFQNETEMN